MLLTRIVEFDKLRLLEKGDRVFDRELAEDRIREIPAQLIVEFLALEGAGNGCPLPVRLSGFTESEVESHRCITPSGDSHRLRLTLFTMFCKLGEGSNLEGNIPCSGVRTGVLNEN